MELREIRAAQGKKRHYLRRQWRRLERAGWVRSIYRAALTPPKH